MGNNLNLAITGIGHLLVENKISRNKDNNPIGGINLVIPTYQRPYKWTVKNVIQLFDDIIEAKIANKDTYRVGTLILHHDKDSRYNVVDGQQRVITFSLLLKALGEETISFLDQPLSDNPQNKSNISKNYQALARNVNNITDVNDKKALLGYIKNNCELIVVITEDISEAFQFFDSQNARGRKLFPHDLLKAYHLREMNNLDVIETEKVVKTWEDLDQKYLSVLFADYLNNLKEWIKGSKSWGLDEHNIHKFKGVSQHDNFPYAQFYKGAYAYVDTVNNSSIPFVTGIQNLKPFQLDAPIIAGKPFFGYAKHYFEILKDIQDNSKYEGYYINDNKIVKTLDLKTYKNGTGNEITRLLFDTAILLYIDRFCPEKPTPNDTSMLDQFVIFAFIWAYSFRAQYSKVGWLSSQNYIMGNDIVNSFNIYRLIADSDSPKSILSTLTDRLRPLPLNIVVAKQENIDNDLEFDEKDQDRVFLNYLSFFVKHNFMEWPKK